MYDGNQVLRFETQYKKKDLYNIGKELSDRKGTGNYDKERTKFNIKYKTITERNLYQEVFTQLKKQNIEYNDKATTNFMNGAVITSGPEFFQKLGLNFKESGRFYEKGKKTNKPILVPNILSEKDIPIKVKQFFDDSYEFIKNEVGEKNILTAEVHFDEDTPQRLIGEILPDLLVKGGDYKPEEIAGSKEVWANGGDVRVLNFENGCSTTNVIEKIKALKD